jgi:predicted nuclease of predicted toxin-antitoxin system
VKIIIDMNLSPRWAALLDAAGVRAEHWSMLGAANAPDSVIMDFAKAGDWIVLTHDLDFGAILAVTHGEKPSVVQIRAEDVAPELIGRHVIAALRQVAAELEEGALLTIDTNQIRLRLLPLERKI